jgi:hypothetical protein
MPVAVVAPRPVGDTDAGIIGDLYRKSRGSLVDSVRYAHECGTKLKAVKASLAHGQWLPWLEVNAEVLGFANDSTARRLMTLANRALAHDLDGAAALDLSRETWGHNEIAPLPNDNRETEAPVADTSAEPATSAPAVDTVAVESVVATAAAAPAEDHAAIISRGPMLAVTEPDTDTVTVMAGTQVVKTELLCLALCRACWLPRQQAVFETAHLRRVPFHRPRPEQQIPMRVGFACGRIPRR